MFVVLVGTICEKRVLWLCFNRHRISMVALLNKGRNSVIALLNQGTWLLRLSSCTVRLSCTVDAGRKETARVAGPTRSLRPSSDRKFREWYYANGCTNTVSNQRRVRCHRGCHECFFHATSVSFTLQRAKWATANLRRSSVRRILDSFVRNNECIRTTFQWRSTQRKDFAGICVQR